jgi:hypothetical protein
LLAPPQNSDFAFTNGQRCLIVATLLTLTLGATAACNASYPTAPEPTLAALAIHVDSPVWDLLPNNTARFPAYAIDSDGVYADVTSQVWWSTSDAGVLSTLPVQNGRASVRGVAAGDADVVATYGGRTDSVTLRVHAFPRSVPRLELGSGGGFELAINPNRATTLNVSVRHYTSNASQSVTSAATITTSDPNVAIVEGGTIRAVAPGTFRILASYNGMTATALASVAPATEAALR